MVAILVRPTVLCLSSSCESIRSESRLLYELIVRTCFGVIYHLQTREIMNNGKEQDSAHEQ